MSLLEERLVEGLGSLAEATPESRGDLARVKKMGRRRVLLGRVGVAVGAAAVVLAAVGSAALLRADREASDVSGMGAALPVGLGDGQTVGVTVSGVSGHDGDDLAGVLYAGGELTDLDRDALGGFWWVVSSGVDATTTEVVRQPGDVDVGRFPFVSSEALKVEPGTYTLVLWVDDALNPVSRWVPINTDGRGLFGCHVVFEVGDDARTDVTIAADLQPDGWNINCVTGQAIPGTSSADAVTPSMSDWPTPRDDLPKIMPPASGLGDGQTVGVTVSGVSGHDGDDLAGVLYAGGELTDLDRDALGGFWWVVSSGVDATTTEVVRQPGDVDVGRFPFVSSEALKVEPGIYTLVLWVDDALNPVSRWVPINTDGRGLFGCHVVFEVGDDARTDVTIAADLQPDGWSINCTATSSGVALVDGGIQGVPTGRS